MKIEKDTDIFKSKKEQIEIIEQGRLFWKITRKHKKKYIRRTNYETDYDIQNYKR
jgi:hypothetical protein